MHAQTDLYIWLDCWPLSSNWADNIDSMRLNLIIIQNNFIYILSVLLLLKLFLEISEK